MDHPIIAEVYPLPGITLTGVEYGRAV